VNIAAAVLHSRDPSARLNGVLPKTVRFAATFGIVTAALGVELAVYLAVS
jgi:hypothetical protein